MKTPLGYRHARNILVLWTSTLAVAGSLISSEAVARYDHSMRFSIFLPCRGTASFCGTRILAQGNIEPDSGKKLQAFLNKNQNELPPTTTLVFDSLGGDVIGAMELGTVIRHNKLNTQISANYSNQVGFDIVEIVKNARCVSSCALAFTGGVNRTVDKDAHFGIHQFSGDKRSLGDGVTQITVVAIATYLQMMGVNRELLDMASLIPANKVRWLTPDQIKRLRIDNSTSHIQPWKILVNSNGKVTLQIEQEISAGRILQIDVTIEGKQSVLQIIGKYDRHRLGVERITHAFENQPPSINFSGINARPLTGWKKLETKSVLIYKADFAISLTELDAVSKGSELWISDSLSGNATRDITLATSLSIEGFQPGVALLLKTNR